MLSVAERGRRLMKPFTMIAAAIFLVMALMHLYRLATGFPVTIGSVSVGPLASGVALVIALVLAGGLFREARS